MIFMDGFCLQGELDLTLFTSVRDKGKGLEIW